jgi:endonuclease/exonuclease/phosphatase family metal-dependent hydrolase
VSVSTSAFTVLANRTPNATRYRVYASATKSDLYLANISSARASAAFSTTRVTFTRLHFRTAPYYYRLQALNATKGRFAASILSVRLRPAAPIRLQVTATSAGTYLTWNSGTATGFRVAQATNAAMTANRTNATIRGSGHQFTPYGLVKATRYYFRVQALNATTTSAYSGMVTAVAQTLAQPVRVMTYNVLEATADGSSESGNVIAPWSQRRIGVAALIKQANPDVVDVQEAAAWTAGFRGPREIDSLVEALGGTYALARTETPPSEPNYYRTANYVLYKTANYRAVGNGGHWDLPYGSFAAYQILENRTTGARLLSVSPHLTTGAGAAADTRRQAQTTSLLSQAGAYVGSAHVPVIYAGDFNSVVNKNHAFDGPSVAMRAAHAADGLDAAAVLSNQRYNSANLHMRTPPAVGQSIDHVYAPAGVAVRSWGVVLNLVNGKFAGVIPSDHNPVVSDLTFPY